MVRLIVALFALFVGVIDAQQIDLTKQVKSRLPKANAQVSTAYEDESNIFTEDQLVQKADPLLLLEGMGATSAILQWKTNSLNRWYLGVAAGGTTLNFNDGTNTNRAALTQAGAFSVTSNFLSNDYSDADTYLNGIYAGTPQIGSNFGNIFATSQADAPNVGFMSWARADSATGDHVGVDGICVTNFNGAKCWGANFIVSNNTTSITGSKLIGIEVDVQPVTEIPSSESAGIVINGFNLAIPGAGLHIGGSSGGTWANGIIMDGIDGAGLSPNGSTTMDSLVNCGSATFNDDCIVVSNAQKVRFSPASGTPGSILAKSDNNLYFIPPTAGLFVWRDTGDSTNRMVLNGATGDLSPGRSVLNGSVAHSGLAAAAVAVGQQIYCTDCTEASDPCTSGGTGTMAFRINGGAAKWKCL